MLHNLIIILGYLELIFHPIFSLSAEENCQTDVKQLNSNIYLDNAIRR